MTCTTSLCQKTNILAQGLDFWVAVWYRNWHRKNIYITIYVSSGEMDWNHKISCSIHESLGPGAGGPLGQLGPGSLSPWPPRVLGYIQWTHKWIWIYLEIEFVVNHRITKSSCDISVLEWIMAPKKQGFGLPWRIQGSGMDRRPKPIQAGEKLQTVMEVIN